MKLTAFTDYSLRVLIYLVAVPQRRATVAEIGAALDIKPNHLSKVVHHLGRCGWIETTRGKGGGLVLARGADDIVVGDVVRDAEGPLMPAECFSAHGADRTNPCVIARCCQLKDVLGEAVNAFYGVLDGYTLADLTRNPKALAGALRLRPLAAPPTRRSHHDR
ncbi:MAG: Rrf2 family transcriptional regulator [Ideonella sp.]|nr:Rrf2 family transcriptional regulator [Ideonella sp.]MCC7457101.1 Rrf2 family transcriptional regulator [Nitrospira sp.]